MMINSFFFPVALVIVLVVVWGLFMLWVYNSLVVRRNRIANAVAQV